MTNPALRLSRQFLGNGINLYATLCVAMIACGAPREIPPGGGEGGSDPGNNNGGGGRCGFFEGPCAEGYQCVEDPSDLCDPATSTDCGGICVPAPARCGFFIGDCTDGYRCVDDPSDQCDPAQATDCDGICERISS